MAILPGINVGGAITPGGDDTNTYPTHYDIYGYGGLMTVSTLSALTGISLLRQKVGMMVYSQDTSLYYTVTSTSSPLTGYIPVLSLSGGLNTNVSLGSSFTTLSANWNSSYSTLTANSANWGSAYTLATGLTSLSSNWQSTYTSLCSNSANWNTAYTLATGLTSLSSNWQNTYTTLCASSANWNTAYTLATGLTSLSSNWQNTYTSLCSNSANWNTAYTLATGLTSLSSNWQNTYTSLCSNSANWNTAYTLATGLTGLSSNWQSTYTSLCSNSANWNTAYQNVSSSNLYLNTSTTAFSAPNAIVNINSLSAATTITSYNIATQNRIQYLSSGIVKLYQFYNTSTNSLDTVFN